MSMSHRHSIVWFRRDLRLHDHAALAYALAASQSVSPVFIFDDDILRGLPRSDRRLTFIWQSLNDINLQLKRRGCSPIQTFFGRPASVLPELLRQSKADALFFNHDYEAAAIQRDLDIARLARLIGVHVQSFKDQVIFEKSDILKEPGRPYKVFTPYKNRWLASLEQLPNAGYAPARVAWKKFVQLNITGMIQPESLARIGFEEQITICHGGETQADILWKSFKSEGLSDYRTHRDCPEPNRTSTLSPYLRFGNISIRRMVSELQQQSSEASALFLSELVWREFFMMILYHFPQVVTSNFNPAYDGVRWLNNEKWFHSWKNGRTGYPLVDAGMRQLAETGLMHNRIRMVTASFLVKHLHVDWRWGERHFAENLLDYELSSNNGNWQWVAGTGVDAAPYFRIFNPTTQLKTFDPEAQYAKRWLPELKNLSAKEIRSIPGKTRPPANYAPPVCDLDSERQVCLKLYRS